MLSGITTGFILAVTLFPAAVWLAQLGWSGRLRQVWAAALALWIGQGFWMCIAATGLLHMLRQLDFAAVAIHGFSALVLVYMAIKMFRAPRAKSLQITVPTSKVRPIFESTLKQTLGMPMRLPAAMSILLATGAYHHNAMQWSTVPDVLFGAFIGAALWWTHIGVLAMCFERGLPEAITLKSLNKIRRFSAVIYVCLAFMSLVMLG